MWVKVVLIILIVAFVSMFVGTGISGLFTSTGSQSTTQTADPVQQINSQYQPQVDALAAVVASQPTSYTALVNLGNAYMDWSSALLQSSQNATAPAMQFLGARNAYQQALKIKKDDPQVLGDYAVVLYYSGETTSAIAAGQEAVKIDPKLATAWFNLGNFYLYQAQNGNKAVKQKAIGAYNEYLKLEPTGDRATAAKQNISTAQGL